MQIQPNDRGRRGAALVIAIAIMTILLAIALTFFAVTRLELKTATNVTNTVRVEFIADAAIAIAVAGLNQDFLANPAATSADHPWRTIYNGAAFAGKPWTWRNGIPPWQGGVPEINLNNFPYVDFDGDGIPEEPLYRGPRTKNWLFIPRVEKVSDATLNPDGKYTPVLYDDVDLVTADGLSVALNDPASPYCFVPFFAKDTGQEYFPFVTPALYGLVETKYTDGTASAFFPLSDNETADVDGDGEPDGDGLVYAAEQIDLWADVDNNGDGLRDSMWIPIPIDIFLELDGMDNDLDGMVDERQDNGGDDDGDGLTDGIDSDNDSVADTQFDPDEAVEAATFIYYAGEDGLDNDGDGLVDKADSPANAAANAPFEYDPAFDPNVPTTAPPVPSTADSKLGFMLTAPLPGLRIPVDVDADGIIGDEDDLVPSPSGGNPILATVLLPDEIELTLYFTEDVFTSIVFTVDDVDAIDNDYDLLVNNYNVYAYLGPEQDTWQPKNNWSTALQSAYARPIALSYAEIDTQEYFPDLYAADLFDEATSGIASENRLRITMTGEPACRIAGRAAILITDEQSKVNPNVAGAQSYFERIPSYGNELEEHQLYMRAMDRGATTSEYETRALPPKIGLRKAENLWGTLTGLPAKHSFSDIDADMTDPALSNYALDMRLPGYGRVDDNGNALLLSMNRVNDDGDFIYYENRPRSRLTDEGLYLPPLSTLAREYALSGDESVFDPALKGDLEDELGAFRNYYLRLGLFEGVDEPAELQRFRPLRNSVAEADLDIEGLPLDNNLDGAANEIGELGDRNLRTREQITLAYDVGEETEERLRNLISVYTADRNVEYLRGEGGIKTLPKLDMNYATPQQIAGYLLLTGDFPLSVRSADPDDPDRKAPYLYNVVPANQLCTRPYEYTFAMGLLSPDTEVLAPEWAGGGGLLYTMHNPIDPTDTPEPATAPKLDGRFAADPVLGVLQTAVNAVDARDRDNARSVLTTEQTDLVLRQAELQVRAEEAADWEGYDGTSTPPCIPSEYRAAWPKLTDLGPREQIPSADFMHLESVEDYAENQLELDTEKKLEIKDDWWAQFVKSIPEAGAAAMPEERRISYTVSGTEAIRINEIMVRPVRRVEAEATPDVVNFSTTTTTKAAPNLYDQSLDPTPFTPYLDMSIDADGDSYYDPSQLPEFIMDRRFLTELDNPDGTTEPQYGSQAWRLLPEDSNRALNDGTFWYNEYQYTGGAQPSSSSFNPKESLPNACEYLFVASEGLPEGRYYLTVNCTVNPGQPTIIKDGQLRYAIKYVRVTYDDTDPANPPRIVPSDDPTTLIVESKTILDGIVDVASFGPDLTYPQADRAAWWYQWQQGTGVATGLGYLPVFAPVTQKYMGLGVDRRPAGWIFLDGQPEDLRTSDVDTTDSSNIMTSGYYEGGLAALGVSSDERLAALATPVDDLNIDPDILVGPFLATHTVLVPPPPTYHGPGTAVPGWALCVALMLDLSEDNEGSGLAVNFFDFSQEPDHEWVELANAGTEPVDLRGWEVEIGMPDMPGAETDPNKVILEIPEGDEPATIAPGGTVLLCVDKFDLFQDQRDAAVLSTLPLIARNGMGLARGIVQSDTPAILANVTVPPIGGITEAGMLAQLQACVYEPGLPFSTPEYDITHSVFDRAFFVDYTNPDALVKTYIPPAYLPADLAGYTLGMDYSAYDFVDRDADDLNDVPYTYSSQAPSGLEYPNAPARVEAKTASSPLATQSTDDDPISAFTSPNKAWDRIIQVNVSNALYESRQIDDIVQIVLQGGLFPDYPEWDGIDNDADGRYAPAVASVANPVFLGVLEQDMVDNDLDGMIDEENEGVDEGRYVGAGSYAPGTLPAVFFRNRGFYYNTVKEAAGYYNDDVDNLRYKGIDASVDSFLYASEWSGSFIMRMGYDLTAFNAGELNYLAPYLGSDLDPPTWKAFAQRRWFPGDNVIVTLYEGSQIQNRVADRVTYNQLDITNRTIDDIRICPYFFDATTGDYVEGPALNPDYPTLWPPNHMGLDFYKSIERKHPLYAGDRFGTQNRWQGTDGNYDDWAESLTPWERIIDTRDDAPWPYVALNEGLTADYAIYRFDEALRASGVLEENEQLQRHAMSGSPLRMNYAARLLENPEQPGGTTQFAQRANIDRMWTGNADNVTPNASFGFARAEFKNGNYTSPGDLLVQARPVFEQVLANTVSPSYEGAFPWIWDGFNVNDVAMIRSGNNLLGEDNSREVPALRAAVLGQATPGSQDETLLKEAVEISTSNPLILTAAQADFRAIRPDPADPFLVLPSGAENFESLYSWTAVGGAARAPQAWTPIFLFEVQGTNNEDLSDNATNNRIFIRYAAWRLNNGSSGGAIQYLRYPAYLLNPNMLFAGRLEDEPDWRAFDGGYDLDHVAERWPYQRRIIGYVADRLDSTSAAEVVHYYPEAMFEWGPEDGLENGDYYVYVGTFVPGLRQALMNANDLAINVASTMGSLIGSPPWRGVAFLGNTQTYENDTVVAGPALPDPFLNGWTLSKEGSTMSMEMEVYTERARTGVAIEPPDEWHGLILGQPGTDGYIAYGETGQDGWRPEVVSVRNNYLALRVRSVSPAGQPNMFTHVVLAPRRNTPGRINVNTTNIAMNATYSETNDTTNYSAFTALMGLPGVVDADPDNPVGVEDPVDPPELADVPGPETPFWPPLNNVANALVPPVRRTEQAVNNPGTEPYTELLDNGNERVASVQLSGMMMEGRPEHVDGRYYRNPAELALDSSAFPHPAPPQDALAGNIYPLSNEDDPATRFDQAVQRYRRMANLITTRSDLFEIITTVQSGYGLDLDGDGFINYRSSDEFVTTAETKVRSVYERRSPRPVPQKENQ